MLDSISAPLAGGGECHNFAGGSAGVASLRARADAKSFWRGRGDALFGPAGGKNFTFDDMKAMMAAAAPLRRRTRRAVELWMEWNSALPPSLRAKQSTLRASRTLNCFAPLAMMLW
jgi:hypothetical protein